MSETDRVNVNINSVASGALDSVTLDSVASNSNSGSNARYAYVYVYRRVQRDH